MKAQGTNIVIVYRSGGDFKFSDVYLLVAHINKYWKDANRPHIYCYADTVEEETHVVGLTIRPLPNKTWKGWWSKMNLFHPDLKQLRPFLYLDIDTAVISSLTRLVPKLKNNFITLRDFYKPNHLASGVMWIPNTAYMDKIYAIWNKSPEVHIKKFRGDQNFIESVTKADKYWQEIFSNSDAVTTFKPLNKNKRPEWRVDHPVNSTVVCFHGKPRIPKAAETVDWVHKYINYAI